MTEHGVAAKASYETLLESLNDEVDGWSRTDAQVPARPLLFVVGIPRSGTTLLYQLLAASGGFAYPSNLIARFYKSPAYGARIQRLLAPLLERGAPEWSSRAGNTEHWWGPHEFGYFWRHHLPFAEHHEPAGPSMDNLARAVAALEAECTSPLLFKNGILCLVLQHLAAAMPTARFVHIHRSPLDVALSLYRMRVRCYGDARKWWSLRPRDVDLSAPPEVQIADQIAQAKSAISQAATEVGPLRWMEVSYDDLCADPHSVVRAVSRLIGTELATAELPGHFSASRTADAPLEDKLRTELEYRGLA